MASGSAIVVEDSASMRQLLGELLVDKGYKTTTVATAEEAIEQGEKSFDLMLIDLILPGMDGLELIRFVRSQRNGEYPYILAVTGKAKREDLLQVLDAGASDYVAKPINSSLLDTRLLVAARQVRAARARRHAAEALILADRMASVGTLAAGVAHELNNPLAFVLTNLKLIREALPPSPPEGPSEFGLAHSHLEDAIEGAQRMANIVRDLKAFSRGPDEATTVIDIREVIRSAIRLSWNDLRHRARLEESFEDVPNVQAPRSRIGQVVLNLLINASQALPAHRAHVNRIDLRTYTDDVGWAVLEVSDNGPGIAAEHTAHIFDPFFTTKSSSEGTGLGLAICRSIVEHAGGQIATAPVPQGTCFRVRLPPTDQPVSRKPESHPVAAPARRGRVVIIDDERILGRSLARILSKHDVAVFDQAPGALAYLAMVKDADVDVILCDLMMPHMSGMELYDLLRERRPELATKMVFMTGGAFTPRAQKFIEDAGRPVLEKPFEVSHVRGLVNDAVGGSADSDDAERESQPSTIRPAGS